jgi:hypothetical protein
MRAVAFLADLAGPGARVLELAIGGGRVALPLARRGLQVEGVEASQAVVQRLRAAPGGESLPASTPAAAGTSRSMSRPDRLGAAPTELTGPSS